MESYAIIFKRTGKNKRGEYKMVPSDYEIGEVVIKEDGTKVFKIDDKEYRFSSDEKGLNDPIVVSFSISIDALKDQIEETDMLGDDDDIDECAESTFSSYFDHMCTYGFFQKYDVLGRLQNYIVEKPAKQIHIYNEDEVMDNLLARESSDEEMEEEVVELKHDGGEEEVKIDVNNLYINVTSKIFGQDRQIKRIICSICKNQIIKDPRLKQNIFVLGSKGTGKTEIFKTIAEELDLPIVIEDSLKFEDDYSVSLFGPTKDRDGEKIDDLIDHLIYNADGDIGKAERGILVVGRIESQVPETLGVADSELLETLYEIMDGHELRIKYGKKFIDFDTSRLTVVATGDFSRFNKVVGYGTNDKVGYGDKEKHGFEALPNLTEKCQTRVVLSDLTEEDLVNMMHNSTVSPIILNKEHFATNYDVDLRFTDDSIKEIARVSTKLKTNARAPFSVIEEMLSDAEFEVHAHPGVYSRLDVDKETVYDNTRYTLTKREKTRTRKK